MPAGFAAAQVLVEGLWRAGAKSTREKFRAALEGRRRLDIGGLKVSYSPEDHSGLDFADLSIIGTDGKSGTERLCAENRALPAQNAGCMPAGKRTAALSCKLSYTERLPVPCTCRLRRLP